MKVIQFLRRERKNMFCSLLAFTLELWKSPSCICTLQLLILWPQQYQSPDRVASIPLLRPTGSVVSSFYEIMKGEPAIRVLSTPLNWVGSCGMVSNVGARKYGPCASLRVYEREGQGRFSTAFPGGRCYLVNLWANKSP